MATGAREAVVPLMRLCSDDRIGKGRGSSEDHAQAAGIKLPYAERKKMAVDERRVRGLKESSRGFRIRMGLLSVEDNGKLFSDVRRLVKNYTN